MSSSETPDIVIRHYLNESPNHMKWVLLLFLLLDEDRGLGGSDELSSSTDKK